MKNNNSPQRLEIFLWLALRRESVRRQKSVERATSEIENPVEREDRKEPAEARMPALFSQLSESEIHKISELLAVYEAKSFSEKETWEKRLKSFIGTDEDVFDENLHWSHLEKALEKEPPVIRRVIFEALGETVRRHLKSSLNFEAHSKKKLSSAGRSKLALVEKAVRESFARRFVRLSDLLKPTAFDRLNGAQTAHLIRLAGIREVAFACARIEAVETIAAFLKRFTTEDARAIAAQLNNLPKTSDARLLFAENLVQKALETEPKPSAMLDLLGIRLSAVAICGSSADRIAYAKQKLPLEFAPESADLIESQFRRTPPDLQKKIAAEIEEIAEKLQESK